MICFSIPQISAERIFMSLKGIISIHKNLSATKVEFASVKNIELPLFY